MLGSTVGRTGILCGFTYLKLAARALEHLELDELVGALVVVTDRGVRIRRAPIKRLCSR